ncbi:MAG: hypothetical protein ACT6FF_08610 [Methanosarcinaceae archaeon]
MTTWNAEHLRLTVFPIATASFNAQLWWDDSIKMEPDTINSQPKQGTTIISGRHDLGLLELNVGIDRTHFLLKPIFENEISVIGEDIVGEFQLTLKTFSNFVKSLLTSKYCPALSRLAFGTVLRDPVDSIEQGYETLDKLLPTINLDPPNMTDFLYQINRPTVSSLDIPNLEINRLTKWSVMRGVSGILSPAGHFPNESFFAIRLELDINTGGNYTNQLPQDKLEEIYNELIAFSLGISINGDISCQV